MRYLDLGRSGLKVSELCLGAMTFGEESGFGASAEECRQVYDGFINAGGNFIDTADIYSRGTSERMLGEFISADRGRLVLASKYSLSTDLSDPNAGGNQRKNLVQSLDASLRRLGTDYIDLYWVHGWDRGTPLAETMRALDDQVRAGKILHIAISNAPAWVVSAANVLANERGLTPFTALQLHYNLIERNIERDYFELAAAQDMAVTAWSPLAGGVLTGKFNASADPAQREGARLAGGGQGSLGLDEAKLAVAEALAAMAGELDCTSAQLALAWMLQRPSPVIPIIGARRQTQLADNLKAVDVSVPAEMMQRLNDLVPPPSQYPIGLLDGDFFQRMMFGEQRSASRRWGIL